MLMFTKVHSSQEEGLAVLKLSTFPRRNPKALFSRFPFLLNYFLRKKLRKNFKNISNNFIEE